MPCNFACSMPAALSNAACSAEDPATAASHSPSVPSSGGGSGDFGDQIVLSDDAATDYEPTKEGVHALRVCGVVLRVCGVVLCDFVVCG